METRNLKILGKNVISTYKHIIMSLSSEDVLDSISTLSIECVTNQPERYIAGTYSTETARHIVKENLGKCDVFIFRNVDNEIVGTISVMYKGGNEIEYKIRNIDAFIYNVLTVERFRGKGYASEMIYMVMEYLQRKRINTAFLAVSTNNMPAIRAYEKTGFKTVFKTTFIRILRINIPYRVL